LLIIGPEMSPLFDTLKRRVEGDLLFDNYARGRYATDASFYQMMPLGVLVPKSEDDILTKLWFWITRNTSTIS